MFEWEASLRFLRRQIKRLPGSVRLYNRLRRSPSADVAGRWAGLASEAFVRDLERVSWSGIPQVHLNHNYLITGARESYWVEWLRNRHFPGGFAGDALSLGCGAGNLDRIFKTCGYTFRSFTGIDISQGAIDGASALADQIGLAPKIQYLAADLNRHELPPHSFDFVYFFQSLHHIEALEHALKECRRALRPGGIFLVNEFVGPSRFQWTEQQVEMATSLIGLLPQELRRDLSSGGVKSEVVRPSVKTMIATDPSEAVRSAEIEPLLKTYFDVFEEWNWGGTLNHLVFQDIAGNFDQENAYHRTIIELLLQHENALVREGTLPSDFKVFLART